MLQSNGFRYCPHCAAQNLEFNTKNMHCRECGYTFYQNIAAAAGAIIYRQFSDAKELLLTVRAHEPERGHYDLPGGFIDPGETLEEGLCRELTEELGPAIVPNIKALRYLCSGENTYCYKQVEYLVCDAFFYTELTQDVAIHAADDVESYVWCRFQDIQLEQMAFESTRKALRNFLDTH